jgi:hypothetical protein
MEPTSMLARHLPLLLLGLLPAESWSSSSRVSDRQVSQGKTASAARSNSAASCEDLREAEAVLAEQEVRLLDRLASPAATAEERTTWKGELINGREFMENLDRALEELRCPGR